MSYLNHSLSSKLQSYYLHFSQSLEDLNFHLKKQYLLFLLYFLHLMALFVLTSSVFSSLVVGSFVVTSSVFSLLDGASFVVTSSVFSLLDGASFVVTSSVFSLLDGASFVLTSSVFSSLDFFCSYIFCIFFT